MSTRSRRVALGAFVVVAALGTALMAGGQRHTSGISSTGPVGLRLPAVSLRRTSWSQHEASPLTARKCRIVVVTTPECGISRALAPGWVEDVEAAADSAGVRVVFGWIVFGDSSAVSPILRFVDQRPPPIWTTGDDLGAFESGLNLAGVPHTLVVSQDDTIRAVVSGNMVVSTSQLAAACRP